MLNVLYGFAQDVVSCGFGFGFFVDGFDDYRTSETRSWFSVRQRFFARNGTRHDYGIWRHAPEEDFAASTIDDSS